MIADIQNGESLPEERDGKFRSVNLMMKTDST